jgi:hypothetical protein
VWCDNSPVHTHPGCVSVRACERMFVSMMRVGVGVYMVVIPFVCATGCPHMRKCTHAGVREVDGA